VSKMKKLLLVLVAITLTSSLVWADAFVGSTPQSHNVTVNVILPPRVGINIVDVEHVKELDLTASLAYPPLPAAYFAVGTNLIDIISTGSFDYAYTASVASPGGLTLGELEYAGNGWVPDAGAGYHPFLATAALQGTPALPHVRTTGWEARNLDYQVWLDGAETDGTHAWTITYTITPH